MLMYIKLEVSRPYNEEVVKEWFDVEFEEGMTMRDMVKEVDEHFHIKLPGLMKDHPDAQEFRWQFVEFKRWNYILAPKKELTSDVDVAPLCECHNCGDYGNDESRFFDENLCMVCYHEPKRELKNDGVGVTMEEEPETVNLMEDYGLWVGIMVQSSMGKDEDITPDNISPITYLEEFMEHSWQPTLVECTEFLTNFYSGDVIKDWAMGFEWDEIKEGEKI